MNIGIDAKWLFEGPPSGKNIVTNIVYALAKRDHNITLYLRRIDHIKILNLDNRILDSDGIEIRLLPNIPNIFNNLFLFPFFINKRDKIIIFQNYVPMWKIFSSKYIAYVHDFLFFDYPEYFTLFENIIFRLMKPSVLKADYVLTISKSEENRILKHSKIHRNKISYVHHGIDERFKVHSKNDISNIKRKYHISDEFILFVGRLNIRKNIKTLLQAIQNAEKKIQLIVIGAQDNTVNIDQLITEYKLSDRVKKLGHIPMKDLAVIYSSAKIFVFPSFAEGFGLPPLESMKSGVPVITTKNTSIPEVCGDAAIYFNENDQDDLLTKIELLFNSKKVYKTYRARGLNHAQKYNWNTSLKNIEYLIKRIINKK